MKASKLTESQFSQSSYRIFTSIELISEEVISTSSWKKALEFTASIDEDDTPFVALALEINGLLWTGDKKLLKGLTEKGLQNVLSTQDLFQLRRKL
ncbi:PIN domain-containing protein [Adhaeribacter pallidiroseus]|uniref:PIN domain-containing protein n=1 Tax=Adhaeribacter pallidiroseus TaxID=2072847 RepID=A0A369QS51_9BACT|nr:PIN domain-containing protein [Adhaeribacter pallidiroseus]RDC65639.1 hypothetical protein AHMF7616_04269 [Adhaeribacter pallidiroseus]